MIRLSAGVLSPWLASGLVSSYPQVRAVTLMAIPTRLIGDAAFGENDKNEMRYAEELIERIPDQSVTVFDKGRRLLSPPVESETSYRELKQTMLGGPLTLRTQDPQGIAQEIWGALIACNLVRLEMVKAALDAKARPTDLGFIRALPLIQHELMFASFTDAYGNIPGKLKRLREQLKEAMNEERRGRQCPRHINSRPAKYPVRFVFKILKRKTAAQC